MANNSNKSNKTDPVVVAGGERSEGEAGSGASVPTARQRARYNRKGELLTASIGTRFPAALYKRYRDYAHFHHVHVRDLIAEAMQSHWDESLGKSYRARLKEAGQAELLADGA